MRAEVRTRTSAGLTTGIAVVRQLGAERLVLQRRASIQAADAPVGLGGHAQGRAGEVMMLGPRLAVHDVRQAPARVALASPAHRAGQARDVIGVQFDEAGDHRGSAREMGQLAGQPILGRRRIGIGGGDQPVAASQRFEPVGGSIHPQAPRRPRTGAGPVQDGDDQAQAPRRRRVRPSRSRRCRRRRRGSSRTPRVPPSGARARRGRRRWCPPRRAPG